MHKTDMTYSTDVVTKGISISDIFEKLLNHYPKIRLGVAITVVVEAKENSEDSGICDVLLNHIMHYSPSNVK